jgi:hypothetical protein
MSKRDGDPWFSWSPSAPFTIQSGEFRVITVSVDPDQANPGNNDDQILVNCNDSDKSPYPNGVYIKFNLSESNSDHTITAR